MDQGFDLYMRHYKKQKRQKSLQMKSMAAAGGKDAADEDSGSTDDDDIEHARPHAHGHGDLEGPQIKAVGWLNLMADSVHNLVDGFALGIAWQTSFGVRQSLID